VNEGENKLKFSRLSALPAVLLMLAGTVFGQEANQPSAGSKEAASSVLVKNESEASSSLSSPFVTPEFSATKSTRGMAPPRPQPPDDDEWTFEISPYLWAAALKGDLRVRNSTAQVDASFSDLFKQLDFALAVRLEAGKNRWRVIIDENYMNLGTTGTGLLGQPVDIQPTLNFFEVGASYAVVVVPNDDSTANDPLPPVFELEGLGGLRHTHFGLGIQRGTNPAEEGSRNLVDFFGGARLKGRPHPEFTIIVKSTVGGGGSNLAWTFSGVGDYRFRRNMSFWGGYQILDMDADDPSNTVGFNGKLHGLIFGLSIYK
jgi:hypothetical protein